MFSLKELPSLRLPLNDVMSKEDTHANQPAASTQDSHVLQMPTAWPGTRFHMILVPRWRGDDERNSALPSGEPGYYSVVCTLGKPGAAETKEGQLLSSDKLSGASHIRVLKHADRSQWDNLAVSFELPAASGSMRCVGYINKDGCMAKIAAHRVHADTFSHAEAIVTDAVKRWLSSVALTLDIPVELVNVHVTELKTGSHRLELVAPVHERSFATFRTRQHSPEFSFYASLYREGLNSSSSVYEFLCFFKILEGLFARRERLNREVVAQGGTPRRFRERLPHTYDESVAFLNRLFPRTAWNEEIVDTVFTREVAGKRLSRIVKEKMRPLRNRVAHGVFGTNELTVDVDTELHIREVCRWLPVTRVLARYLLSEEFPSEFLATIEPSALQLIPIVDAEPKDDIFRSPTISNIEVQTAIVRVPGESEHHDNKK